MDRSKSRVWTSLKCTVIALACVGGLAPVLSFAAAAPKVTVKYDDLNLNTPQGAGTLLARIRGAARQVCGEPSARLDLQHAWQVCYQGSIAGAVAAVDSPLLSALASGNRAVIALNR